MWVYAREWKRLQKPEALDTLQGQELKAVVSSPTWVLGTQLQSSEQEPTESSTVPIGRGDGSLFKQGLSWHLLASTFQVLGSHAVLLVTRGYGMTFLKRISFSSLFIT